MQKNGERVVLLLISFISGLGILFLVVVTSRFGPGISHDSVAYIYASRTLIKGEGLRYFGYEAPFIQWPPLYPIILALLGRFGLDAFTTSRLINVASFGLIIFFSGTWLLKHLKYKSIVIVGTTAISLSIPLVYVSKYAWSEPLFILFTCLAVFLMGKFIEKGEGGDIYKAAFYTALACITRYIGITLIFTGLIITFISSKGYLKKIITSISFSVISSFPLFIWLIRNYIVSSTFTGIRTAADKTIIYNLNLVYNVLLSWFMPMHIISFVFIFALLIFIIIIVIQTDRIKNSSRGKLTGIVRRRCGYLLPLIIFFLVYITYLVFSASKVAFDPIDSRLLAPVFVPLSIIAFCSLDFLATLSREKISTYIVLSFATLWVIHPLSYALNNLKDSVQKGTGGFSTSIWMNKETIKYLRTMEIKTAVLSNYADAVYILAKTPSVYPPRKNCKLYGMEQFLRNIEKLDLSYIAWFKGKTNNSIFNLEELSQYFDIGHVISIGDGDIYTILRKK